MIQRTLSTAAATVFLLVALSTPDAQAAQDVILPAARTVKSVPRPPMPTGVGAPAGRSSDSTEYSPIPQWLGQTRAPRPSKSAAYSIETAAEGFNRAFSFNFLPDGRMLVAERSGHIKLVGLDGKVSEIEGPFVPARDPSPASPGIFEVRPDRAFATNRKVYLTYVATPDDARGPGGVAVVASATLSVDEKRLENIRVLMSAEGMAARVAQVPDGTLLVTSSTFSLISLNARDWPQPQQLDNNMGKILRINTDGTVPADNPFVGRAGANPEIYALGLRDIQGLAIHPHTGKLWTSEHGPRGGDEINIIKKGGNYGFPVIGYGREYDNKPINNDKTSQDGMEQPVYFWTPDIAPAGIAFYTGRRFPEWRGNLFVASLANHSLVRLVLKGERVVAEERLLTDLNSRIRGVNEGPDGALYVLIDGTTAQFDPKANGRILRLVPKK